MRALSSLLSGEVRPVEIRRLGAESEWNQGQLTKHEPERTLR
ncbi:hypothetical protein SynMITS9220_01534 [Synechococcus sp. MIT S9220]|nr:hypothetical protein SynMITS9220_01534 [Synechococcus sp. MIT S9220]